LVKRDYSKKGITLATTDVTIAAVALYHQPTLMTGNLKHYPMKELSLYPLSLKPAHSSSRSDRGNWVIEYTVPGMLQY